MGLITEHYDKANSVDYCWYDSSTILYSKCDDKVNSYKDVEVTFADGRTYKYFDVTIQDYLLFKNGGLDNSQGKALNKFIKKYKFQKLDKLDIGVIEKQMEKVIQEKEIEEKKVEEKEIEESDEFSFSLGQLVYDPITYTPKRIFKFYLGVESLVVLDELENGLDIIGENLKQAFVKFMIKERKKI